MVTPKKLVTFRRFFLSPIKELFIRPFPHFSPWWVFAVVKLDRLFCVLEAQEYALGTVIIHFQNLVGKTAWEAERSFKVATKKYDVKVDITNLIILPIAKISFFNSFVL